MKQQLLIDAGNSNLKWTILDGKQLYQMQRTSYAELLPIEILKRLLRNNLKNFKINTIIMVSVLGDDFAKKTEQICNQNTLRFIDVKSRQTLAGVTNAYKEPNKLGADRFVGLIAGYHLTKSMEKTSRVVTVIVDSGTATTIDAVDSQGRHLGGVILPGLSLCHQSLLGQTQQLSKFSNSGSKLDPSIFSVDTNQAITSGNLFGLAAAINGICFNMEQQIKQKLGEGEKIVKVITGGTTAELLPYLSSSFLVQDDLLMQGLKVISEIKTKS